MEVSAAKRIVRICFYAAVVAALAVSLAPTAQSSALAVNDKVEHFAGFLLLTWLGIGAFGRRRVLTLSLALLAFGAAIEILQMLPFIGRDGELFDWIADTFGVLTAWAIVGIAFTLRPQISKA